VPGTNYAGAFLKPIDPLPLFDAQGHSIRKKLPGFSADWHTIGLIKPALCMTDLTLE
jgi:hypothetical protein